MQVGPKQLGGPTVPQASIDETYWRLKIINKWMAGNPALEILGCYIWGSCAVRTQEQQGRIAL